MRDLAADGRDLMAALGLPPGPEIGRLLHALLEEVLEEPERNERERLLARARELHAARPEDAERSHGTASPPEDPDA